MEAIKLDHFVRLAVPKSLEKKQMISWYNTVRDNLPQGVLTTYQAIHPTDGPKSVRIIHNESKSSSKYDIPLSRDLLDEELSLIVSAWNEKFENGDFDIEGSNGPILGFISEEDLAEEEDMLYEIVALEFAKRMHQQFYKSRVDEGWRYGLEYNPKDKTDPRLRDWNQLPNAYRKMNKNATELLVEVLDDYGFLVVPKDHWKELLRKGK